MTILLADQIAAVRDAIDWESMSTYSPERVPALRAALATLEASAWRPIKTAPRDEEVYLLACAAGAKLCGVLGWDEGEGEFYWLNGMFRKESKPTHWRPLPEPPQEPLKGKGNYGMQKNLNHYRDESHADSVARGWWDIPMSDLPHKAAVKIALIHSEISEALEGIRKNEKDRHLPARPAGEVELADALIRIFDLAGAMGYDLEGAYTEKREYNRARLDHNLASRARPDGKRF